MRFNKALTELRRGSGLTKTQLAQHMGVTPTYVMNLELDRQQPPSIKRCQQIARILRLNKSNENLLIFLAIKERHPAVMDWLRKINF